MRWYSTLAAVASLAVGYAAPTKDPVCIVGAGPAGLAAAARLESQGQTTTIFEKQALVGGKCQALFKDGRFYPLGALLFTKATYVETFKIINSTGVSYVPWNEDPPFIGYNWTTGVTQPFPPTPAAFEELLQQEIIQYITYWETNFAAYSVTPGYKNGVPREWTVPTAQWLLENGYQAFQVLIVDATYAYGYGDYREVPILYIFQYVTPDMLVDFATVQNIWLIDFHAVFTQFAKSLRGKIHLSSTITKIDRTGPNPVITYHSATEKNPHTQKCSSLILAFPPTIPALQAAGLTLSPNETEVFSPIGLIAYYSGIVNIKSPPGNYEALSPAPWLPPPAAGEPVAFIHLWPESTTALTYSWGAYRGSQTVSAARALLESTLSAVNRNLNPGSGDLNAGDVLAFVPHDYFPHFDGPQLAAGFYDKFNRLQGQQHTYFASGLNMFETVEFAVRAGYDVVDSYF